MTDFEPEWDDAEDLYGGPLGFLLQAIDKAERVGSVAEDGTVVVKPEHWQD